MDEKKKKLTQSLGDDSGEMDVIKDIFSSPEPDGAGADIFSSDLFKTDPFAPPPAPPLGARVPTPAPPKPAPAPVQPVKEQIKVVTNQDFEQLLQDQNSPGIPAPAKPAPAKATPPLGARVPTPAPAPAPAKPAPAKAAPPLGARPASAGSPAPPKEETLDDMVLQAVAEDYHAVGAAKKGAALAEVAHELEGLEPMRDNFMSIEELKKLFRNTNNLIEAVQNLNRRLEQIEKALTALGALKK
jgi:hypothetical protein